MKKYFVKTRDTIKDTFRGLTWREAGAAARDTGRDIFKSRREALTFAVFMFASPVPGSVLLYMGYRLHMYRAKTGKIDAMPQQLLSDERLAAIKKSFTTLPKRVGKAVWGATPVAMRTTGAAVALAGAGVSGYSTVTSFRDPAILNYSLLKECNEAMRRGSACSAAGAAEKQKSLTAMKRLGGAAGGMAVMGGGMAIFAAAKRRKK